MEVETHCGLSPAVRRICGIKRADLSIPHRLLIEDGNALSLKRVMPLVRAANSTRLSTEQLTLYDTGSGQNLIRYSELHRLKKGRPSDECEALDRPFELR